MFTISRKLSHHRHDFHWIGSLMMTYLYFDAMRCKQKIGEEQSFILNTNMTEGHLRSSGTFSYLFSLKRKTETIKPGSFRVESSANLVENLSISEKNLPHVWNKLVMLTIILKFYVCSAAALDWFVLFNMAFSDILWLKRKTAKHVLFFWRVMIGHKHIHIKRWPESFIFVVFLQHNSTCFWKLTDVLAKTFHMSWDGKLFSCIKDWVWLLSWVKIQIF